MAGPQYSETITINTPLTSDLPYLTSVKKLATIVMKEMSTPYAALTNCPDEPVVGGQAHCAMFGAPAELEGSFLKAGDGELAWT